MNKDSREISKHHISWRAKLYEIIFEAETPLGKAFDVLLLWAILFSVFAVTIESVAEFRQDYGTILRTAEWTFTILFTLEYFLRIICVKRPIAYIFSFFGVIDLLAIIPTYLSLFLAGAQSLIVIRALRLLRVFRILKLGRYLGEVEVLMKALKSSRDKIIVFLCIVLTVTLIMGTVMYLIEGDEHGFTSIPKSIYWAIVTMTTVGYGDMAPETALGQTIASVIMILGYAIIVVPTGIFSVELSKASQAPISTRACPHCTKEGHELDSKYCRFCGGELEEGGRG